MKKQRGITLIALIITIIVLLILAGVALNSIFGQGSLIGNAQNAVDEYNKKVEEEKLALEQIEEYIKNNGVTQTGLLQLVDKGIDFIKVKVEGENYEEFEFSIDNGEYLPSDIPEYTFNNLEVTIITNALEAEEGTMHTIKVKAKNKKTGQIEQLNSIQVATDVLVESEQVPYFKYEDNGEGITITELVPFNELIADESNINDWNNFFNNLQETIVVPSYIDEKPVTKVTTKFIKQVANIDTYEEAQIMSVIGWLNDSLYVNDDVEMSDLQIESDGSSSLTLSRFVPEDKVELICVLGNQIGRGEIQKSTGPANVTFEIQNGIVKNGNINLILPPTVDEILPLTITKQDIALGIFGSGGGGYEPDPDPGVDPDPVLIPLQLNFKIAQNNESINNTIIYMLGKGNQEKEILKDKIDIDWNIFTQVKVQE